MSDAVAHLPPAPLCTPTGLRKAVMRPPQPSKVAMLHTDALPRYVDPLPIPAIAKSLGMAADPKHPGAKIPLYKLPMQQVFVRIHRDVAPTHMWAYGGSVPGPTIEVRRDQAVQIEFANELPQRHMLPIDYTLHGSGHDVPDVRTIVHLHGARVPPDADGYPEHWYPPGKSATHRYPNGQDATGLWYHDHAMAIERLNVYAGLFGTYLIRDDIEDGLGLPRGEFEIPLMIFDRLFTADGQLYYPISGNDENPWVSEVYGDALLVNGKLTPFLEVEPRTYRFRITNASNARFYYLAFSDGTPLHQIGSDQGLLAHAVTMHTILLAPAERADVIVDFAVLAGKNLTLKSQALEIMQFRVKPKVSAAALLPAPVRTGAPPVPRVLRPVARIARGAAVRTRRMTLNDYEDPTTHMMLMLLNDKYWHDPVTEKPVLDSVEIWEMVNLTEDTHPVHLHLVRFQVLDRQRFDVDEYLMSGKMKLFGAPIAPRDNEHGWKDTVQADAGIITRIIIKFEGFAGRYVWHCHVLEHSANEMMRPFDVLPQGHSST